MTDDIRRQTQHCSISANVVRSVINRLDNHWTSHSQELRYDWEAELSGTGSRSRVEL